MGVVIEIEVIGGGSGRGGVELRGVLMKWGWREVERGCEESRENRELWWTEKTADVNSLISDF